MREKKLHPTIAAQSVTYNSFEQCKGKTIEDFEFGAVDLGAKCHMSERAIIYFTDGSSLTIDIGSNAFNLSTQFNGLKANDVRLDISAVYKDR
jgi:hypothetical protein